MLTVYQQTTDAYQSFLREGTREYHMFGNPVGELARLLFRIRYWESKLYYYGFNNHEKVLSSGEGSRVIMFRNIRFIRMFVVLIFSFAPQVILESARPFCITKEGADELFSQSYMQHYQSVFWTSTSRAEIKFNPSLQTFSCPSARTPIILCYRYKYWIS